MRYIDSVPTKFVTAFLSFICVSAVAQTQDVQPEAEVASPVMAPIATRTIKIKVMQKGTGQPLRKVEVKAGGSTYFSDPEGLVEIPFGNEVQEFVLIRNGFETLTLPANDYRDTLELDVYLFPRLGAGDEVIVKGKRRPSVSKKVISAAEAARVAPGGDPGQITKLMPGVTTSPGRSEITIRGSAPEDSLYQIDDINVAFLYHSIGQLTVIPPSTIEDVEFSSGGFGAEYGDSTGGVVVIRTKKDIPERAITRFTLNLPIYSGVYHERPLSDSTSIAIGARRSYLEAILPKFLPKDSGITLIPFFSDYQGSWTKKTDVGSQKLTLLASKDGLKATLPSASSDNEEGNASFFLQTYFGVIAFEQTHQINPTWSYTSTPQVGHTDAQFETSDLYFRIRSTAFRVPTEFSKRISSKEKMYLGLDPTYSLYKVGYQVPKFDGSDPYFDIQEAPRDKGEKTDSITTISGWIARDFLLGDLLLTPGLRTFHSSQTNRAGADPRLSSRYSFTSDQVGKFAIGQYSQFPKNGEAVSGYGNTNLKFTNAMHYILGIESKWNEQWETDFQVFYKYVRDVIRTDPETSYNNDGSLRSRGAEVFVRRAMSERWFGWLAYTWSKTEERKSDETDWYTGDQDQTHVLSVAGNYRWTATWETGGRLSSHTGDVYTSKVGPAVYNANLDKYQSRNDVNTINNKRLPHYNELALYSAHDFLWDTATLTFRWGLEYLWFKPQVLQQTTNYDYTKEEPSQGVPPIPYIELRGEF